MPNQNLITAESTLSDLAMRRAQLGVTELLIVYGDETPTRASIINGLLSIVPQPSAPVRCYCKAGGLYTLGRGEFEHDAINHALVQLVDKIGKSFAQGLTL